VLQVFGIEFHTPFGRFPVNLGDTPHPQPMGNEDSFMGGSVLAAQHIQTPEGSAEPKVDMGPLVEAGLSLCGNIEQ
jgi:hypothetical protein